MRLRAFFADRPPCTGEGVDEGEGEGVDEGEGLAGLMRSTALRSLSLRMVISRPRRACWDRHVSNRLRVVGCWVSSLDITLLREKSANEEI